MSEKKPMGKIKRGLLVSAPLVVGMAIAVYVWGGSVLKCKNPNKSTLKATTLERKIDNKQSKATNPIVLSHGEKIILENYGKDVIFEKKEKQESSSKQIVQKDDWTLDVKVSTKNKDGNPNNKQVNIGLDFNF